MEFIINVAPGPLKAPWFLSTKGEEIAADETAPAVAFVFKSQVEQHIGEITYSASFAAGSPRAPSW